ncbi:helix-turn-helix transcriptional regulator [Roseomonas sp. BN140053]|uniref:helix-turn-helix transcriptional regulator n=1 Tax=Roseomonas sp. BN140053 TaxID=3391898 RepID=UPI0039EC1781
MMKLRVEDDRPEAFEPSGDGSGITGDAASPALRAEERDAAFLHALGERLRVLRARRGMARRVLSQHSGVSERYIAQLESGAGNISILLLRRISRALGVGLEELVTAQPERSMERVRLDQFLGGLSDTELTEARSLLGRRFGSAEARSRRNRLALIGLRGAGKSTLGRMLAARRGIAFVELDREVEREGGMDLRDIFETQGQEGFRRLERATLQRLVRDGEPAVIAAGGGIVAEAGTFGLLLDTCLCVWVRASPEEHMRRVMLQGDLRPMRDNNRSMDDLRAILASREALYAKADFTLDTSGRSPEECLEELMGLQDGAGG